MLTQVLRRDAEDAAALELYVLTEPRHAVVRGLFMYGYWRKQHRILGVLSHLLLVDVIIIGPEIVAALSRGVVFFVIILVRWFLHSRNSAYRDEIKRHFRAYALKANF